MTTSSICTVCLKEESISWENCGQPRSWGNTHDWQLPVKHLSPRPFTVNYILSVVIFITWRTGKVPGLINLAHRSIHAPAKPRTLAVLDVRSSWRLYWCHDGYDAEVGPRSYLASSSLAVQSRLVFQLGNNRPEIFTAGTCIRAKHCMYSCVVVCTHSFCS